MGEASDPQPIASDLARRSRRGRRIVVVLAALLLASALVAGGVYAYLVYGPGSEFLGTWELRATEWTGKAMTLDQARKAAAEGGLQKPTTPGTMFLDIWWDRTMAMRIRKTPGGDAVSSPEVRWGVSDDELSVDPDTPLMGIDETTGTIVNGELRLVQRGRVKAQSVRHDGSPPEQGYIQEETVWYRVGE